jgi:hypothetical protein
MSLASAAPRDAPAALMQQMKSGKQYKHAVEQIATDTLQLQRPVATVLKLPSSVLRRRVEKHIGCAVVKRIIVITHVDDCSISSSSSSSRED